MSFTSDRCFKVTSLNLSYCCTRIVKWGFEVWKIKQNSLAVTEYYKCSYCLNNNYKSLNNRFEKNSHVRIQSTVVSHSSNSINSCLSQFGFHQQLSLTVRIPSTVVSHSLDSTNSCLSQLGFHQQLSLTVRIPSTVVSHRSYSTNSCLS